MKEIFNEYVVPVLVPIGKELAKELIKNLFKKLLTKSYWRVLKSFIVKYGYRVFSVTIWLTILSVLIILVEKS
jgi:hypothetical protein